MTQQKRERSVAHLWADKRVMRFFRQNFERKEYKRLRNIYLALCEIDSDFTEERENKEKAIYNLTKTCSSYSGMDMNLVNETMQALKTIGLIDYGRKMDGKGRVIGSFLVMYMWDEETEKNLIRENPNKGKPLYIKNILKDRSYKNDNKLSDQGNSFRKELPIDSQSHPSSSPRERPDLDLPPIEEKEPAKSRPTKEAVQQPQRRGRYLSYENASKMACQLVNHWNSLESTVTHRLDSKGVERVLYALDKDELGVEFDVMGIMDDFDQMLSDPDSYDVPRRKVGIDEFFFGNDFVKNGKRSWFKRLQMPGGCRQFLREEDENPEITAEIRKQYEKGVLAEAPDYTPRQEADFVKAAKMLRRYMKKGRLERYVVGAGMEDYVHFMLKALANDFGASNISTGHLRSEYTYNSVLPRFLSKEYEE